MQKPRFVIIIVYGQKVARLTDRVLGQKYDIVLDRPATKVEYPEVAKALVDYLTSSGLAKPGEGVDCYGVPESTFKDFAKAARDLS